MSNLPHKVVQGSFHQGDLKYGYTAGIQCSCNTLVSICFSKFKEIEYWKFYDLDFILDEGDKNFKQLGLTEYPYVDQFPKVVFIEEHDCNIEFELHDGEFTIDNIAINFISKETLLQHCGAILIIREYCISVMFHGINFFVFDSHSKDALGNYNANGKSILMQFYSIKNIKNYVRKTYANDSSCYFQVIYVKTDIANFELKKKIIVSNVIKRQRKQRKINNSLKTNKLKRDEVRYSDRLRKKRAYESIKNTEKYENNKKHKRENFKQIFKKNFGTEKHIIRKEKMKDTSKKYRHRNKVQKFKETVTEGPFFICVCCNRCLYRRSVILFSDKKYFIETEKLCNVIPSFNDRYYICITCHTKLCKKQIPCQSVFNKLEIYDMPELFSDIGKLERMLISQRILFQKIAIMPKGQFPKIKGAICNIPVDTTSVCNTLPRDIANNNILFVQLKRKLSFKFPVISEQVRPEKLNQVLSILCKINHLYKNVVIGSTTTNQNPCQIDFNVERTEKSVNSITFVDDDSVKIVEKMLTSEEYDSDITFVHDDSVKTIHPFENFVKKCELKDPISKHKKPTVETTLVSKEHVCITFVNDDSVKTIHPFEHYENEFEMEDPLNKYQTPTMETMLVSEIPNIFIDNENLIVAPGQGKTPFSITTDEFCEELAHPHLFPYGKFGYHAVREVSLSAAKYFNQRLLNYSQKFASDSDYIFFSHQVLQQLKLKSNINIAMKKVTCNKMTAGMLQHNFQESVKNYISSDNAYRFMKTIKGTPAYWKNMLSDVLAMVKQLGMPSYFMTLSCADLQWEELIVIIRKLRGENICKDEIDNLSYFDKCADLNSNPVLLARHFQYRVENFFKEIILNGQLGKITYYAIRVEFQARGSPHVHCLLWAKSVPKLNVETKQAYIQHIDSVMSASIPSGCENMVLKNLVKKFQIHSHSKTCRKYNKDECRFGYGHFFCNRTIVSVPLPETLCEIEKKVVLKQRNLVLSKVKSYIDLNLNPRKKNILEQNEPDFIEVDSIENILKSLGITLEDYEHFLSISPDKDFHIHLKRDAKSCFVNNYFSDGLLSWEANIDIQPVCNYYKAVTYMCAYFSKCEEKCSVPMKEAFQQAKDLGYTKFKTMTNIAKAYNSNREVSVQEAVYLVMPELWLRKCFPTVAFINTNTPDQRYRIFKSQDEIEELAEDSNEVFIRNMLDRYVDRPNKEFHHGKYAMLDEMCYASFCAHYTLDTKSRVNAENDWQPVILDDGINEINHVAASLPKIVPLMSSTSEKLKCRKVPRVLRYYTPSQHKSPEKFAHHMLMLFYPFRSEEKDLKISGSYVCKLNEPEINEIVNRNKYIFEPNADIVELVLHNYQEDVQHNQDAHAQQENEEVTRLLNESISAEEDEENHTCLENYDVGTYAHKTHNLLNDNELNNLVRTLNKKQRQIFDAILQWGKKVIRSEEKFEPLYIFLTGGGGVGKSHLINCVYNFLAKVLLYKQKDIEKPRVIKLAPTGIASINIQGTTIHSGLCIPINSYQGLSDKQRTSIRNKLQYVKLIIIDEISMVSSKLLLNIHKRLCEIFGVFDEKPFGGKSIVACGDLYQLPPVMARPVFDTEGILISVLNLWRIFKLAELDQQMRQKGDDKFIDLLNDIRVGEVTSVGEELIKSRFISTDDLNYPWNALHLFAENNAVLKHNLYMLNTLPSENVKIIALDNIPTTFTRNEIERVKKLKQSETGGLAAELDLKIDARVMLISNIDIEDRLINGQLGTVCDFLFKNERIEVVYVKFDDRKAGTKLRIKDRFAKSIECVPIERLEATFSLNKKKYSPHSVKRNQFPLMLSYACTIHKVQGLTLDRVVISFNLERQRTFNPGQMYVAMSRVKTIEGLFFTGNFTASAFICNNKVKEEYTRLRMNENQLPVMPDFFQSDTSLVISLLNIRSLKLHSLDVPHNEFLQSSDILCFTETQIGFNHTEIDLIEIKKNLSPFEVSFNNDQHKYNSMAICHQDTDIEVLEYDHSSGYSLMKFKKGSFSSNSFYLLLIYRSPRTNVNEFLCLLSNVVRQYQIDLILGDFNINGLDEDICSRLNDAIPDYQSVINFPTHIDGGLLDHIYVHQDLLSIYHWKTIGRCINVSDHDVVKLKLMYKDKSDSI